MLYNYIMAYLLVGFIVSSLCTALLPRIKLSPTTPEFCGMIVCWPYIVAQFVLGVFEYFFKGKE